MAELDVSEIPVGWTKMDKINTEHIRGAAHVGGFGGKVGEARLRHLDMCRGGPVNVLVEGGLR